VTLGMTVRTLTGVTVPMEEEHPLENQVSDCYANFIWQLLLHSGPRQVLAGVFPPLLRRPFEGAP